MKEIFIDGVIGWDVYAQDIRDQLKDANGEDVKFLLSSPGGFISEGLAITNLMRNYKGKIKCEITGEAASMATYIAMFADSVTAYDNSVFMIHNALGGVMGDYREVEKYSKMLESMTKMLANAYIKKTGKSEEEIRNAMNEETYLFGSEIQEYGFADEIINTQDELDALNKVEKISTVMLDVQNAKDIIKKIGQKEDFENAAAMINTRVSKPAEAGENKTEVKMTLNEFLASNPEAKSEYEKSISEAKNAGADEVKMRIDEAVKFVNSNEYSATIKEVAVKAMKGEKSIEMLNDLVSVHDEMKQGVISQIAQEEQAEIENVTAQVEQPVSENGVVKNENDFHAQVEEMKKHMGVK